MKQALRDAIENRGYTTLTPVQKAVLEPELEGRDLLVSAQTGSGKTVGFGLAIAPTLLGEREAFDAAGAPLALVIAPTRELALQVKRELGWLYQGTGAVVTSCVGGMDMRDERRALARGAHIVVATPGRLRDHLMRGSIDLTSLRAVVLDEADEMLDLGFRDDLEFILAAAPETRQTLMFSATVPKSIADLARRYQRDAVRVVTRSDTTQHADIEYRALSVSERDTENAVINTLLFYEAPSAIVFANTRAMVNRLATRLSNRGFQVVSLSGELSQSERTHALQAMRDGRARVCVATDVAARGIDLPNLDLVVHAELPTSHETLLHRSGRTGRAGRKGVSALIVPGKARRKAERILSLAKLQAEWAAAPSADEVRARDEARMLSDPEWQRPVEDTERETIDKILATFTTEQVAAAYLRLYRMSRSAPEDLSDVEAKRAPRGEFGPSVWFAVSGGRRANAEPRRLLPVLCNAGGLTRDDIGAIRIGDDQSHVQIREPSVAAFLEALGPGMTLETGAVVTRLDGAPAPERSAGKPARRPDAGPRKAAGAAGHRPRAQAGPEKPGAVASPEGSEPKASMPRTETLKTGKPKTGKPRTDRPRTDRPWADKPSAGKPEAAKPRPHRKTPRKATLSAGDKPPSEPRWRPDAEPAQGDQAERPERTSKGPPPPKGKATSKKNKARALTARKAKTAAKRAP